MNETKLIVAKPQQSGYTLVELAIAVAILAVLIVAGLTGVQSILTSGKVNDQIKTIAKLSAKVTQQFNGQSAATSGITQLGVVQLGAWEQSKYSISGTVATIRSSFNTLESIAFNSTAISGMDAGTGFFYQVSNVPATGCPDLLNGVQTMAYAMYAQTAAATATSITSSWTPVSTVVKAPGTTTSATPANIATACGLGTNVDIILALKP